MKNVDSIWLDESSFIVHRDFIQACIDHYSQYAYPIFAAETILTFRELSLYLGTSNIHLVVKNSKLIGLFCIMEHAEEELLSFNILHSPFACKMGILTTVRKALSQLLTESRYMHYEVLHFTVCHSMLLNVVSKVFKKYETRKISESFISFTASFAAENRKLEEEQLFRV